MIELAKPESLNPPLLWQQMKDAGLTDTNWMYVDPDENGVSDTIRFLDLDESDRATVEAIFAEHSAAAEAEETRIVEYATNENTIRTRMDAALSANRNDIATNDAWLTANPNAPAVQRELVRQSTSQARQLIGIIRTLKQQFDAVE